MKVRVRVRERVDIATTKGCIGVGSKVDVMEWEIE